MTLSANPAHPKTTLAYWMIERERVRQCKEAGQLKPWSLDPIFRTTYFCNVRREDDRVTRWIRENFEWLPEQYREDWVEFNMLLARLVNKPESLYEMGWPWASLEKEAWFEVMSKKGAWGGAYIVSTNGRPQPKHEYIWGLLEGARAHLSTLPPATLAGTLRSAHSALQGLQGLGSFMAAQVVADLKNTPGHPLANADDWSTFAAPGPGSLRGLTWFHKYKVTPANFEEALASARRWLHNNGHTTLVGHLCNQDLQNCFCEYDKYMRVLTGTGRSKRRYDG